MPSKLSFRKTNETIIQDKIKEIISEYKIQRSTFNPDNKSPNIFINNLRRRMSIYYNLLNHQGQV
jgi:hypothetical protein